MTTILIEPRNATDHQLFVSLAKRLKAKFSEQDDYEAPTKAQILQQLGDDFRALQNGTLETRLLKDVLDEL